MKNTAKLEIIKIAHTLIWAFFASLIFYVLYCGLANQINVFTWIAIALIFLEGLILLIFNMFCPLTLMARKYTTSTKDNFDIYLPNVIARYNKLIFSTMFVIGLLLVTYRTVT